MNGQPNAQPDNEKVRELDRDRENGTDQFLTTNQGLRVNDDQNSLKDGPRGATLLEDFILREKITHFDHERIPERVVHARGVAAHGYFEAYGNATDLTRAHFLQPGVQTPVFTRFSTVAGSRGATDLARDVRGFAVKFYTQEGVFDLVGNNIPVFFIQDAIKFPDLIHAVKPEPHNEIPQGASAHNTFWDWVSATPEAMHMIMWIMSGRALPRSLRMMEGFGVHTFRFVNEAGESKFIKFHWKPLLGAHSVMWEEAQLISGKDPDFHRRDLWETIANGDFPEWELGVQVINEADEQSFDFDILDSTKLIPEEQVPIQRIGKMVLNRNPDNYFAETEQVAYHLGHVVPGIDFSNDPLLQGRLFSYTDTQLKRLGGPNFHEIPINRSVAPVHNNQRDGHMRQTINVGTTSYQPNLINGNYPAQARRDQGGFNTYPERVDGRKIRARSDSFKDHYSQALLFWNSQTDVEKTHIVKALRFELGKVNVDSIRERMLIHLSLVNDELASRVAEGLGLDVPSTEGVQLNFAVPADVDPATYQSKPAKKDVGSSAALQVEQSPDKSIKTRQVAVLLADGFDGAALKAVKQALTDKGAMAKLVGPRGGKLHCSKGDEVKVDFILNTTASVLFDAVYVAGGADSVHRMQQEPETARFIQEMYRHCKPIAASGEGAGLVQSSLYMDRDELTEENGFILADTDDAADELAQSFVEAMANGRFWQREMNVPVPA